MKVVPDILLNPEGLFYLTLFHFSLYILSVCTSSWKSQRQKILLMTVDLFEKFRIMIVQENYEHTFFLVSPKYKYLYAKDHIRIFLRTFVFPIKYNST